MGRKELLRRPIRNFRRAMRVEDRAVEAFHPANAALLGAQTVPQTLPSNADGSDRAESGDDRTPHREKLEIRRNAACGAGAAGLSNPNGFVGFSNFVIRICFG